MRRAVKLKASVFLIAWFVMFFHSIIPHNHVYECIPGCSDRSEITLTDLLFPDSSLKIEKEHSDPGACHLGNSLFNTHNPEIFLAYSFRVINFTPERPVTSILTYTNFPHNFKHLKGTDYLRAPPKA